MMKLEMATRLHASALEAAIRDPTLNILLIDCRSFMDFNSCHIANAHNVHFPPIVRRRSGGSIPLVNIIRCAKTRGLLLNGQFDMVVLYDESSLSSDDLPRDSVIYLVLKSLRSETDLHAIYLVEGGFRTVLTLTPHLCSGTLPMPNDSCTTTTHLTLPQVAFTTTSTTSSSATTCSCDHLSPRSGPQSLESPACDCSPTTTNSGRRDSAKMRRILLEQDEAVQVLPWLYLGSVHHASQPLLLEALGVRALLNVTSEEYDGMPESFCYKTIPVADSSSSDLFRWFPEAIEFIESVRLNNSKVLVHCQAGVSRSATICLAYLMYHKCLGLEQAYDFLKARRSVIAPNLNFMQQLLQFEEELTRKRKQDEMGLDACTTSGSGGSSLPDSSGSSSGGDTGAPQIDVTVESPKSSSAHLNTDPCASAPCGFIFSFDSPISPLVSNSAGFATCSPLVSPS